MLESLYTEDTGVCNIYLNPKAMNQKAIAQREISKKKNKKTAES